MTKYWNIFLHASWNYAEIEELLNMGSGGGSQFQSAFGGSYDNPPQAEEQIFRAEHIFTDWRAVNLRE